jgi:anti-anti-sigma factor
MKTLLENDRVILCPEGHIDSVNALTLETEMLSELEAHPGLGVSIDAGKLEYISSAGLRVLLRLLERTGGELTVFNVTPEVYDILEMTGFSKMLEVKKRIREISVEGCELIGSGAYGRVYRLDRETIAKLYSPNISLAFVEQEREVSRNAFLMRVPTAIAYDVVKCGDCYGVVYELL